MGNKFNRRSIRLQGYDYSQAGAYFITICCQDRICRFGRIINGEMILNAAGTMVDQWIQEISNKFIDIQIGEYIIMPNHIHFIVINNGIVGVDLRVNPNLCINTNISNIDIGNTNQIESEHTGSPLHHVVQWFKTMTTNAYIRGVKNLGWEPFNKKIWQRNYYEHIIRNEKSYQTISQYIQNNPLNWEKDKFRL